ncbi:C-C motif chemokine 19-like [Xiphias gladius]|uniref:C-C motif chemokine 19-like n=1 Tax=Xiphias gladius TaxID=8245 RepID=UPI001A983E22|nr:C-C motif chemokine 19-like [Xiphias gladius]
MAPWGDAKLFLCFLFITCCCTVTLAQIPMDCCLSVKNRTVQKGLIVDYRRQTRGNGCFLEATILVTKRGRTLCVPPEEPWVKGVEEHVDKQKANCGKKNRRCPRVKHQ